MSCIQTNVYTYRERNNLVPPPIAEIFCSKSGHTGWLVGWLVGTLNICVCFFNLVIARLCCTLTSIVILRHHLAGHDDC